MELLLVRHAIARESEPDQPDEARALTGRGRRRFARSVMGLHRLGIRLDLVLHSPLLRAVQTAEGLVPLLDGRTEVTELLGAAPGAELVLMLSAHGERRVALVGHEPWMGDLLALLVHGSRDSGGNYPFRKGGVAWLVGDPGAGLMTVRAFLPPKILRGMARR